MSDRKQTITMNSEGELLTSCDTLFSIDTLSTNNMREQFPFLDSVFNDLLENLELGKAISFPRVATKHTFLKGFYDYRFQLIKIHPEAFGIQWELLDSTEYYAALKAKQQSDHEGDLATDS